LKTTGDYWKLLKITGDNWRLLEITGDYWILLEITGDDTGEDMIFLKSCYPSYV